MIVKLRFTEAHQESGNTIRSRRRPADTTGVPVGTAMTIVAGTTVHWKNLDPEPHTVRSVETGFRSDPLDQNDSFTFKFDKPGTYRYVCSIHPQMVGTIVVKAAN